MSLFNNRKTLSIDFGASEIKVVEGKFLKKGIQVSKNFSIDITHGLYEDGEIQDMDQLSYVLREGLKEHKLSTDIANGVINSSQIITREITMPKITDSEIDAILKYQVGDYIPIHPDDYIVKHLSLDTVYEDGIERMNLLLIGIPKSIVETHLNLLKNIGLKPQILDYQGNVSNKLLIFNEKINDIKDDSVNTIALIDLGYDSTKLTITNKKSIRVSRTIDSGAKDLIEYLMNVCEMGEEEVTENLKGIRNFNDVSLEHKFNFTLKEYFQELTEKIEMIFRYYKTREIGNDINLCILQGGLSNIKDVEHIFSNFLQTTTIKLNSLDKIKFKDELSKYSNAIGGLIRWDEV